MQSLDILEQVIQKANSAIPEQPGDYRKGGLLYCGNCHTAKETRLVWGQVARCLCSCSQERRRQEQEAQKRQEEADKISRLRSVGMLHQSLRNATFETDDGKNAVQMAKLKRYADKWHEMQKENIGLLLYGGVGTGKSFGAACIANQLMGNLTPVLMTNLASVLNTSSGLMGEEKNNFLKDVMRYPLLILDDFGMERGTEYALEQVYNLVNARYESKKPLIVTTNLSLEQLHNPADTAHARIYDRILEMCVPLCFGERGRRAGLATEKMCLAAELLRDDG